MGCVYILIEKTCDMFEKGRHDGTQYNLMNEMNEINKQQMQEIKNALNNACYSERVYENLKIDEMTMLNRNINTFVNQDSNRRRRQQMSLVLYLHCCVFNSIVIFANFTVICCNLQ